MQRPWMSILAPSLMVLGLGCLVLGWAWTSVRSPAAYWGDKEAADYAKAQVDLHSAIDPHGHSKEKHEAEMAAARERFNQAHAQLEEARISRSGTAKFLTIAGVLLLVSGVGIHLVGRQSD